MNFEAKNYDRLYGTKGFSDALLKNHLALYEGYVKNTGRLYQDINRLFRDGKTGDPQYSELKRRFAWEFNGMRLHDLYFGNMTREPRPLEDSAALKMKMAADFGSFDRWEKDFKATGGMRGIGWVVCCFDPTTEHFLNVWINEHDLGHLAGCAPLLVMDVFEHAFITDYGLNKSSYIDAFFSAIDWNEVERRFEASLSLQPLVMAGTI